MAETGTDLSQSNALEQEKEIRRRLSTVFNQLKSHFVNEAVAELEMEDLIAESIFQLDSTQIDLATQIAESPEAEAQELQYLQASDTSQGFVGLKQRLEQMNEWMVGRPASGVEGEEGYDPGEPGLIEAARAWEPDTEDTPEEDVVTQTADEQLTEEQKKQATFYEEGAGTELTTDFSKIVT